jgi:hypothetical protein
VSDIQLEVKIRRFDQALFAVDTNNVAAGVAKLRAEYGVFFDEVFMHIMEDQTHPNAPAEEVVGKMIKSPAIRSLYDTCQVLYGDLSQVEAELTQVMKFFRHYFPNRPIPEVVAYLSEYALGTFTYGDSLMGVGLDFFLGEGSPRYDPAIFPHYIQKAMSRPYLVPKMTEAMASNLVGDAPGNRLLDHLIHNGKVLYVKDLLLPRTPDSIKLEYSQKQVKWVEDNELEMWTYFLKNNLIYSTKMQDIQKLIHQSPTGSSDMPTDAPGRTANWVGWQIVKSYMEKHPKTTLEELLAMKDAQQFLEQSKYKPKR